MPKPLPLRQIREQRGVTQVELAERMGIVQENVSRVERSENPTIGTVRRYVEALGGELQFIAHFEDGEPVAIEPVAADSSRP